MAHINRIGFRRASEVEEVETRVSALPMDEFHVQAKQLSEAHQETRTRIEVLRDFIATTKFTKLPVSYRKLKVRELEWLSRVEAELSAKLS